MMNQYGARKSVSNSRTDFVFEKPIFKEVCGESFVAVMRIASGEITCIFKIFFEFRNLMLKISIRLPNIMDSDQKSNAFTRPT